MQLLRKPKGKKQPILDLNSQNPHFRLEKIQNGNENLTEPLSKGDDMKARDVIDTAMATIVDRSTVYGDMQDTFDRVAKMASVMLGKEITAYECSLIMMALKMSRIASTKDHHDSYVDLIAYTGFAAELANKDNRAKKDFEDKFAESVSNAVISLRGQQVAEA